MPRKERIQKRKEKERQEAAKSSKLQNAWLGTRSKTQERTDNSDVESVTPEREVEISQATVERQEEALEATPDDKDDQEITVGVEEKEATGREIRCSQWPVRACLKYPTDPVHNQAFDLKCNASYVKMCVDRGPCQPVLRFPKNTEGRSFQNTWYENRPWLEYSPDKDSIYCFSCRLFLNEPKYNKNTWRVAGVNNWKKGLEKNARACRLRGPINKHGAMEYIQKECFTRRF